MVLVSNEWQSKCEDETKTIATTANTGVTITTTTTTGTETKQATANTTTSTTTSSSNTATIAVASKPLSARTTTETATVLDATALNAKNINKSEAVAQEFSPLNSTAITTQSSISESTVTTSAVVLKTIINDNANNEQNKQKADNNSVGIVCNNNLNNADDKTHCCKISEVEILLNEKDKLKENNNLNETVLNYTNKIKIMAENSKEFALKEEKESESQAALINNQTADNNKDLEDLNLYPNSNTNTLQAHSSIKQNIVTQQQKQQQQMSLSCPAAAQSLSIALQSALNATNNANNINNSVAAAGLQPNFLSQLALTANVAGLQKSLNTTNTTTTSLTAKQLNQSFNTLDTTNNQTKNDSNILEGATSTTALTVPVPAVSHDNNMQAKIVLICEGNSHPFQTRTISLTPNVECMVGRLIAKSKASETNAIFDCKVLSRKHAVIWYTPDNKFWVKDTKSSNGTFINDNKLGDEEAELHFGDIVKFGVDVLENSRKEVHGCIIACVKLYLPDGREAISIDSSAHRGQYSGEGRISYDELHRLNLYIQETSQREKVLTSKLCNIQNVLDATRKNSALCWQSMITEDQLLHRIHSLEKKLKFMEKNVPENVLRNEVLKLLDDKSTYQLTAKEALRKVYQERCDAMQMLAKMESAYTQSDNECSLLRDQIMNSKQTLQEVNSRLLRLETEYNEYKDDIARQQQEAQEREEQRILKLTEKLRERELECEDLKKKISELLIKRANLLDEEDQLLEKQAIEKLDAAIADIDLGNYGDSESENVDSDGNDDGDALDMEKNESKRNGNEATEAKEVDSVTNEEVIEIKKRKRRPQLFAIFGDNINGNEDSKQELDKSKLKKSQAFDYDTSLKEKSPPKRVKETTIMKWLQNSDINKNEGSFDIFKAICNENENEEYDENDDGYDNDKATKEIDEKRNNFTSKLKNVQIYLQQLEAEIEKETDAENEKCAIEEGDENVAVRVNHADLDEEDSSDEEDDVKEGACADKEFIINHNRKITGNEVLSKENKKYLLLKSGVNMLREAYNEIWHSVKEQDKTHQNLKQEPSEKDEKKQCHDHMKGKSLPPNIKVKTQLPSHAISPTTLPSSESDVNESDSDVASSTVSSPMNSTSERTIILNVETPNSNLMLMEKLKDYQSLVEVLNEKLHQTEMEAQHTLEIMQVECDDTKMKVDNLNKVIESLRNDKKALEEEINQNKNNSKLDATTSETSSSSSSSLLSANEIEINSRIKIDAQLEKELELNEDPILNAINVTALECEEELILYKERLDEQQKANIELRNEIALLKLKANTAGTTSKEVLLKQFLPYGFIALAIIVYFLTTYF